MKSKLTRAISLMLSAVMLTTMFSGCEKKAKEGIAGQATSVSYNTDGTFTTTVTAAVSYTHLDVYKRQLHSLGKFRGVYIYLLLIRRQKIGTV